MQIISRHEALALGLSRYSDGKPCRHGHQSERYASNGVCVACSEAHRKSEGGKYSESRKRWRSENIDQVREKDRERWKRWKQANHERLAALRIEWEARNVAARSAYIRSYREENRDAIRASANARKKVRRNDPLVRMRDQVSSLVRMAFLSKGFRKGSRTESILGCTWEEFLVHIERQFLPGMTWENRHLWHIDHIIPLATAKTEADVIALNHVSNLRPMWAKENMQKKDKVLHLV